MSPGVRPRLRDLTSADRDRVIEITRETGVFREEELDIAGEVFADCVNFEGPSGGEPVGAATNRGAHSARPYYGLGAELGGQLVGWICWGRTPCTEGTWDLYWLAVNPEAQGHGVGTALTEAMERRLAGIARLVSVDTSGRPDYAPTRDFYLARGYRAVARVPDFYAPGDDQVIFTKAL